MELNSTGFAGEQFGTYFRLAAAAAGVEVNSWVDIGKAFGVLLQLVVDLECDDDRLFALSKEAVQALSVELTDELKQVSRQLGKTGEDIARKLLTRSPCNG